MNEDLLLCPVIELIGRLWCIRRILCLSFCNFGSNVHEECFAWVVLMVVVVVVVIVIMVIVSVVVVVIVSVVIVVIVAVVSVVVAVCRTLVHVNNFLTQNNFCRLQAPGERRDHGFGGWWCYTLLYNSCQCLSRLFGLLSTFLCKRCIKECLVLQYGLSCLF